MIKEETYYANNDGNYANLTAAGKFLRKITGNYFTQEDDGGLFAGTKFECNVNSTFYSKSDKEAIAASQQSQKTANDAQKKAIDDVLAGGSYNLGDLSGYNPYGDGGFNGLGVTQMNTIDIPDLSAIVKPNDASQPNGKSTNSKMRWGWWLLAAAAVTGAGIYIYKKKKG